MFASARELDEALRRSGYIADSVAVTTVYLAAALHRPVLLEGPAGSGKTQLAYAVAEAAHTRVERLQCYVGINEEKAIGKFDESLQRLFVQYQAQSEAIDWDQLAFVLQGRKFFSAGPLLLALECEQPCVLLIDELDKVDHSFEAQAFKRSCAAFGLGRYLYYFPGVWIEVDRENQPLTVPLLPEWAIPERWLQGLRPDPVVARPIQPVIEQGNETSAARTNNCQNVVVQVLQMQEKMGTALYRGLLKSIAQVWCPTDIRDITLQKKVLRHMEGALRGLERLKMASEELGQGETAKILASFELNSTVDIKDMDTLYRVVLAVEEAANSKS